MPEETELLCAGERGDQDRAWCERESKLPVLVRELRRRLKERGSGQCQNRKFDDDEFLSMFLRTKGYDLDRAHESILKYYRHFDAYYDLFANIRTSAHYKPVFDKNIFVILRQKCKSGRTVIIFRVQAWDPAEYDLTTIRHATALTFHELVRREQVQRSGVSVILDLAGFFFAHLRQNKPRDLKNLVQTLQDGSPIRIGAVHIINYQALVLGLYYIAYGFMKEKLRRRIHFHKNTDSLHEYVDPTGLPTCLGGARNIEEVVDRDIEAKLIQADLQLTSYYF